MSGAKRNGQRRKGVEKAMLDGVPELGPDQEVVRVVEAIGGNLIKIETAAGEEHLCRLPQRFSRVVFVKRGSLLIARGGQEDYETSAGKKGRVKFLADTVLLPHHLPHLIETGSLPEAFRSIKDEAPNKSVDLYAGDLIANRNRPAVAQESDSEEEDDDDDEEEEDDDDDDDEKSEHEQSG